MKSTYITERLIINALKIEDYPFIYTLINTPSWKQFIGNNTVNTIEEAKDYVQKLIDKPALSYATIRLLDQAQTPIGIVSLIKRNYLDHHDIGYALLPAYTKYGYATEAVSCLLADFTNGSEHPLLYAIANKDNVDSIRLLEKLGFVFDIEIVNDENTISRYVMNMDKRRIDKLTSSFFEVFNNRTGHVSKLEKLFTLCIPQVLLIDKGQVTSLTDFTTHRQFMYNNGTLMDFQEKEVFQETTVSNSMAQRFSRYQKQGYFKGCYFRSEETKLFQYIKTITGWRISSVTWE